MKAFLLAGGQGTRLRPLTDDMPKCLVPIRGEPLLGIWLDLCSRCGITDVVINLHAHAECVERYLMQCSSSVNVRLVREEKPLGSAGTLLANRNWVRSDSAFWILYSDILTNTNLKAMSSFHSRHGKAATLGLCRVADPSRCGVALVNENGLITDFEEKPRMPRSDRVFSGLMVASPEIFDCIPARAPSDIGFDLLPTLLGKMMAYPIEDYWIDIGTIANYEAAQSTWPGHIPVPASPGVTTSALHPAHSLTTASRRKGNSGGPL